MNSIRKWLYRPKKTDKSLLAQFYFADEELNTVASELDSFDSRKDPERCQALVAQLRACQDKVLTIIQRIMTEAIPYTRSSRDFRVKFPDDVVQENLAGQLWFGAECLAAGSSIMNRELESASMRPLARALTKNLDSLRHTLRDQCLVNVNDYTERIREALVIFDKLFAEFELSYVSAMVPVKSVKEYETIQDITVLFSETTIRAKARGYVTTDMIDEYDPALMFTIPRLAIVCGLLVFGDGPLNPENQSVNMSDMFRPFQTLLYKIRELLYTLTEAELLTLERALCSQEEPDFLSSTSQDPSLMTGSSVSTSTIAVQTDSPLLRGKGRKNSDSASCSSADRLDDSGSDNISLTSQQQRKVDKGRSVEQISCQSGRLSETPPSDAAFCEMEDAAAGQAAPQDASRQSKNLNKSDSNDSGLHSDVVSACDSQFTVSPSGSSQLISQSGCASVPQSPLTDEVMELCMGHSDADSFTADSTGGSAVVEMSNAYEAQYAVEGQNCVGNDDYDKAILPGEDDMDASPHCEDCGDERLSGEEDSFYTPSSGVSPLHQPSYNEADKSGSHQTEARAMEVTTHHSADSVSSGEDADENKENSESHGFVSSLPEHRHCERSSGRVYNVLQRVQEAFVSHSGSSLVVDGDAGNGDSASDVYNSSLTDSTLTDLTPPDHDGLLNPSSPDTQPSFPASMNSRDRTQSAACSNQCDTADMKSMAQAVCGLYESQNPRPLSVSNVCTESGVASTSMGAEDGSAQLGAGSAVTELGAGVETSCQQCDRCTQTPHSAISNDQSSKIYHHHHHHHNQARSHSSLQDCAGSSFSVPSQDTSQNCDSEQHSSRHAAVTSNFSDGAQQSLVNSPASSATTKQSGEEKSLRSTNERVCGSRPRKPSSRTHRKKAAQHSEVEREARLRQYEDNWSNCSTNTNSDIERKGRRKGEGKCVKTVTETSSSSYEESSSASDCESDEESCRSSETSSYNSESHDDEEIALAVQAAELANRNQARARFRSSSDMIHRLFVCISGVADQLQTNFAGDLRNILRVVFNLNCSEPVMVEDEKTFCHHRRRGARFFLQQLGAASPHNRGLRDPPAWVPDDQSTMCMSCKTPFTFVRRRHHCRNCGKIFCGRCSSNAVSLPHFGHSKPVRVCNHCFVFQVNPFAMQAQI